jgi:hypothetical protein
VRPFTIPKLQAQLLASLSGREKGTKANYLKFTIAAFRAGSANLNRSISGVSA